MEFLEQEEARGRGFQVGAAVVAVVVGGISLWKSFETTHAPLTMVVKATRPEVAGQNDMRFPVWENGAFKRVRTTGGRGGETNGLYFGEVPIVLRVSLTTY